MAYPPAVPSGARINTTPQVNTHPADHLAIHAALTDIINELGASPKGDAATVQANFALTCPLGVVLPYAGTSAPAGWGLCDGSAVSRTTYAELFALIGTLYGTGDGSTTFNIPDLRNRFIAGKGTVAWSDTLNDKGGSKDTTLVDHQHAGPSHQHTQQGTFTSDGDGAHSHGYGDSTQFWWVDPVGFGFGWAASSDGGGQKFGKAIFSTVGAHDHATTISGLTTASGTANTTGNTATTGVAADTNLPPYITLNHIIRLT